MFTGLVEATGTVVSQHAGPGVRRLVVSCPWGEEEIADGESVAVDGVCLTVAGRGEGRFEADVVAETLARTTLGSLAPGSAVHLERALRLGDRLGGHLVQGHVDGMGEVRELRRRGGDVRLRMGLPLELRRYVALKGSIAVQGVSLTVAALDADAFEVALVPQTLSRTGLGRLQGGDRVNVEVDLLARYLESLLGPTRGRELP